MYTTSSTNLTDVATAFGPATNRLAIIFSAPELRPPVYEEMVEDMGHIINKVVAPYVSQACVEMHFEELVAECWCKTTRMNSEGLINRARTRSEYFAMYKTAISNHVCSLVQRHIFTEKRTGVKAPPKEDRNRYTEHVANRPLEIRIDDPESNVQLSEMDSGDNSAYFRELLEDVSAHLNYIEQGVLNQLLSPNETALFHARMEAETGRHVGEPLHIRIRQEHLALGLGISLDQFRELHEAIKRKCLFMKNQQYAEDPKYASAMATLLAFFGLQIPRSIDETTCKRALMIAARHQYERLKDNEGVKTAMETCQIPVPELRNDRFNCFGIMFQKHHRTCENCGVKEGCEKSAANFGLGEITISHKLLGARHARLPVVRPGRLNTDAALADEREEEILTFLDENFRRVTLKTGTHFRHKSRTAGPGEGNEPMIFALENASPLVLRFINPADELKASLTTESTKKGGRPSWILPSSINSSDAINLIRTHAQITFAKS
jgi:hypothetical protein